MEKIKTADTTSVETNVSQLVYIEPDEQRWDKIAPTPVSIDSLMAMRNGVFAAHSQEPYKGTMVGTMLYRLALDCDHAARLLKAMQRMGKMFVTYSVTGKTPKDKSKLKRIKAKRK